MNKKRQFALNKLFNLCIVVGLFLAWFSVVLFKDSEITWAICTSIAALLFIIVPVIFTPFCYSFDSEGVSLCYVFLPTERYLWKDIRTINVEDLHIHRSSIFLHFFCTSVFNIECKNVGKQRFYMTGNIRKSIRTKYLLEKYWDGTITGYLFEDTKKWIDKRRAKKQSQVKEHFNDEIVLKEREIRAKTREWLKPFVAQAKQYDLDIRVKYLYITKDLEEHKSRPKDRYTYTLIAEIEHFNETDKNRIIIVSVDLLYVRLGKESYRGVQNEHAKEELQITISDALSEINRNGIDFYCNNN